jgi:meckelin
MESNLSTQESLSPENYGLNFVVITLVIYGIGVTCFVIETFISPMFAPDYVNFVDLCSVANISVIMFNEELNGYYIHGKSANGASDVSSEKLRLNLESEMQGNASIRGIHSSMPEA